MCHSQMDDLINDGAFDHFAVKWLGFLTMGLLTFGFLSDRAFDLDPIDVHGIAKCTINKKSAKLIAIHNIPLPHTHIIMYCNKLNSNRFCK